ncbi:hypothetical protein NHF45_06925 [Maricaulaceae bacterium NA33B04]|nr:hypothetical protein [Maricaulaceae bacterium NA33B04]
MTFLLKTALATLAAIAISTGVAHARQAEDARLSPAELVEQLQSGGLVMLIRHERTEVPSRRDDYTRPADDCRAQRNLSVAGAAGALETGFSLRALEINADRVITSPMCRSAETARNMFGPDYELDPRLMHHDPNGARNLDVAEAELRTLLSELAPVAPGSNIALVSHGGNIFRVSGLRLTEGEIGVLRIDATGEVIALGQITGSTLGFFARNALEADE